MKKSGFTLIELLLAMILGATLLGAIILLIFPLSRELLVAYAVDSTRYRIASHIHTLETELRSAKAIYVDNGQCYKICYIDSSDQRVLYYFSGNDLLRTVQAATTAMSCTGGTPSLRSLDSGTSSFTLLQDLLTLEFYGTGSENSEFRMRTSIFPYREESGTRFHESFECAIDTQRGWSYATDNGAVLNWSLYQNALAQGSYCLRLDLTANQGAPLAATATFPLGWRTSRSGDLQLSFKVRNNATPDPGELLRAYFYDGTTWNLIFTDNTERDLSSWETQYVDLSSYERNPQNQIRFEGLLSDRNHDWYIDDIQIYSE